MMSILSDCVIFWGGTIASGITWDLLKTSGANIIKKFTDYFISKGYFTDSIAAEAYLKRISDYETYDEQNPMEDALRLYRKYRKQSTPAGFEEELRTWLQKNICSFNALSHDDGKNIGVTIHEQNVYGGRVENIGIKY